MDAQGLHSDQLKTSRKGCDQDDPCPELTDEELCAAEIKHFDESTHEDSSVSYDEWRRYHGLKARLNPRVPRPLRQSSRSRRAPRRARPSRRARPASRATG